MGINLREDQEIDYKDVEEKFKDSNKVALIRPTGTGKQFIGLKMAEDNKEKRVLYLAPSTSILHQVKENAINNDADFISRLKRVTYQKLAQMSPEEIENLRPDIIILDEFHHCGSPVWGKAVNDLCNKFPSAKVLGLSATPIRYFDGNIDMAEEMFGNNVVSNISFYDAVEKGILPEFDYVAAMYGYEDKLITLNEQIENANTSSERRAEARKLFEELSKQLSKETENLPEILEKHMKNKNGKYIVFCSNIEDMQKKINESQGLFFKVNPNIKIYNISSDDELRRNQKELKQFENDSDEEKLKLMFSVNMLNEGYHLPDIDGVVMMRPTKSPTIYMQQMGRALAIGNSSNRPVIIDLVDNFDSIRIIKEVTDKLVREYDKNTERTDGNKKFEIFDYTRNIEEVAQKIENLCKKKTLTIKEKIDLFERYIEENPNETIHNDTVFEGYPIGMYLILIRQAVVYGKKNMLAYNDEDKERLEELGLLYESIDTIEEKVERLKSYCKEHPYTFSYLMQTRDQLQLEGKKEELEQLERLYIDYRYVNARITRGKISNEIEEELTEAKIGGRYGLAKEDVALEGKSGITRAIVLELIHDFGSFDNFRKEYIKFRAELADASFRYNISTKNHNYSKCNSLEKAFLSPKEVWENNPQMTKYINKLLLVKQYDLIGNEGYRDLVADISMRYYNRISYTWSNVNLDLILEKGIEENIELVLDRLQKGKSEKYRDIVELVYGLRDKNARSFKEVGELVGCTGKNVSMIVEKAKKKLSETIEYEKIRNKIGIPNSGFVRKYFQLHDIFVEENEPNLTQEQINDLMVEWQKCGEKLKEQRLEGMQQNLLSITGFKSVSELVEKMTTKEELAKLIESNKLYMAEVEEIVQHSGLNFKFYEEKNHENNVAIVDLDMPIERMDLSVKGFNALRRSGVETVGDIILKTESELMELRNFGRKNLEELVAKLESMGLKLKEEVKKENEVEEVVPKDSKNSQENKTFYLDMPIEEIGLSTRAFKVLIRSGIKNVGDIVELTENQVMNIRSLGTKSFNEIVDKINSMGLKLKEEEVKDNETRVEEVGTEKQEDAPEESVGTEEQKEERKDPYTELVSQILGCDTEYTELGKKIKEANEQRESVNNKIEELINQIDGLTNGNVTQDAATTIMQAVKVLNEQKNIQKELESKLKEMQAVKVENRKMKSELAKNLSEMIRGGE